MDVLQHEHERLKQKYFHERRKGQRQGQRQRANQETSGRRSNNSRRISKQDVPKSDDTTQPSVNSTLSEDEEDFRSGKHRAVTAVVVDLLGTYMTVFQFNSNRFSNFAR